MRFYWIQPQYDASHQTATFLPDRFNPNSAVTLYHPTANGVINPITGERADASDSGKIVPGSGTLFNGIAQADVDVSRYLMENRGIQFGPRFGMAFDITGKQNLVLRAGAGIFYDRFQGNETFDMLTNPPTTVAPTLVNGDLRNVSPITDINQSNVHLSPFGLNAFSFE